MLKKGLTYLAALLAAILPVAAQQEADLGAMFEAKVTKSLSQRWEVGLEEELRLQNNLTQYDRSVTSATVEYAILPKRLKAGALYSFLNVYNNDHLYQNRHRYALMLRARQEIGNIRLSLRVRYQSTYKQEVSKTYKINPENYLRTKLEIAYKMRRSRWEPSLSGELFYTLNDPYRNVVDRIRTEFVLDYRLDRRQYLAGVVRVDIPIQDKEPQTVVKFGLSYKFNW